MGYNVVEKILRDHLLSGSPEPGSEVVVKIDQTLTQDATGTMAYLQLEAINPEKTATELSVSYVDHNTTQIGFENADDHRYLQSVAAKYGIYFSRPGNGICHQVHLERFARPGRTLLGSDSHTPTCGGMCMLAMGAGGLDVAVAMASGSFTFAWPKVTRVFLTGKLNDWVAAKDVALKMLSVLSTKGNVGTIVEYAGPGVETLSVPERATITNMGAELGVTTSVFPGDSVTKQFLAAEGRAGEWTEITSDDDAVYDKEIKIDLSELVPLAAAPHSPDNVVTVAELAGKKVDQVAIGSCTNSSYRDLMIAAHMLEGRKIADNVSFVVAPGSKQVLKMIADEGAFSILLSAGARFAENACGFCIGNSMAPGTEAVSVRTSNRNFLGRSGTKSAGIYLTSVETAVACAIRGEFTDPGLLGIKYPVVKHPGEFAVDDSMIIHEGPDPSVEIFRGPNIGAPPANSPLEESVKGVVTIKVGDKITTDHIMPAGDKLKYRSNIPKYSEFVFAPVDDQFSSRAMANKEKGVANIVVAGLSYGQGSSREHAALCPMYLGVKAVIAKSFERIHTANLINSGIVPLTFAVDSDCDKLSEGDEIEIPEIRARLAAGKDVTLKNITKNLTFSVKHELTPKQIEIIQAGGRLNLLAQK